MHLRYALPLMLVIACPIKADNYDTLKGGAIGFIVGAACACTYHFMSASPTEQITTEIENLTRLGDKLEKAQAKHLELRYAQCEKDQKNSEECKKNAREIIHRLFQEVPQKLEKKRLVQLNTL